jgi:hypothetical protein
MDIDICLIYNKNNSEWYQIFEKQYVKIEQNSIIDCLDNWMENRSPNKIDNCRIHFSAHEHIDFKNDRYIKPKEYVNIEQLILLNLYPDWVKELYE